MKVNVVIDHKREVFMVPAGQEMPSPSPLGFEYVFEQLRDLVAKQNLPIPVRKDEEGTVEQYAAYRQAIAEAEKANIEETWLPPDTPVAVRQILERYRESGDRIRLFHGNTETDRDWLEDACVIGVISRLDGLFPRPILIGDGNDWGICILDHCLVRLMDSVSRKVLWTHPRCREPSMRIVSARQDAYPHTVLVDGVPHEHFQSHAQAARWVAFMAGESMEALR